jgi:hypothetical protein
MGAIQLGWISRSYAWDVEVPGLLSSPHQHNRNGRVFCIKRQVIQDALVRRPEQETLILCEYPAFYVLLSIGLLAKDLAALKPVHAQQARYFGGHSAMPPEHEPVASGLLGLQISRD